MPNQQNQLRDFYIPLTLSSQVGDIVQTHQILSYPKALIDEKKDVLIVDSAGMGKSTLLKFIFLSAVETAPGIPIFVELRKLSKSIGLVDHICNELKELNGDVDKDLVVRLLESGVFLIFLDGYDEIPDEDRGAVTTLIVDFKRRANGNKFIMSSRELPELTSFADFFRLTIRQLNFDEATQLISKYGAGSARTQTLIERLRDPENSNIKEFLGNPLLVSLLFKAYDYKPTLPLKKHIFYRQVYEALYENHDLSKEEGGFARKKKTGLTIYDFELVVRSLGFVSMQTSKVEYTKDRLLQLVGNARAHVPTIQFDPQNLLKDLSTTVPLFTVDGTLWRWSHKSLQEYFSALYVSAQGKEFQARVLTAMYESASAPNYINFLSLFADIEPKGFRHILARKILSDLRSDFDTFPRDLQGVAADALHERWRLTCLREIAIVSMSQDKFSDVQKNGRSISALHETARKCLGARALSFSRSQSRIENPALVVMSTPKLELMTQLFNSGVLDQYKTAELPRMLRIKGQAVEPGRPNLPISLTEGGVLHDRSNADDVLNSKAIYSEVNDRLRMANSHVPIAPLILESQLAEIETEIRGDELQTMQF